MQVERCRSCGARYNVTSLEPGRSFPCTRCGSAVVAPASAKLAPVRSLASVLVGVAMLLSLFLYAHPTIGAVESRWPWAVWADADAIRRADLALWVLVGVLAVLAGLGVARRATTVALFAAALWLAVRGFAEGATFEIVGSSLAWMAAVVALGVGFLGRASPARGPARADRVVLVGGAATLLAIFALSFATGESLLASRLAQTRAAIDGHLSTAGVLEGPGTFFAQMGAIVLALYLAAVPRWWPGNRLLGIVGFAVLLLVWALPTAGLLARTWEEVSSSANAAFGAVAARWFSEGLAVFLVCALAGAALLTRSPMERGTDRVA